MEDAVFKQEFVASRLMKESSEIRFWRAGTCGLSHGKVPSLPAATTGDAMFKQALATFVALLGLSAAAAAQTAATEAPAQTPTCPAPRIAGQAMALNQVPGSDLMTVPVQINGTPKQFLLDIGTTPDEVSAPAVAELHLPEVDQSSASNALADLNTPYHFSGSFYDVKGANNNPMDVQTRVRVASFTIAGTTVTNLEFLVADDRELGKSKPYDGLLTGSLFPQYDFNFDFGAKQFSFFDPTSCADPNRVAYWPHTAVAVVPMTMSNGKMSVPVTINGHQVNAVLDTGSAQTVMRRDIAENVFGLKTGSDMTPDGDVEDGAGMQVYLHTFPQIAFEGVIAQNVPTLIEANSMVRKLNRTPILGSRAQFSIDPSERIPDLALGMDVLHQLHLYAAFDENKLYVTAAK
jgi:hypothetical protein